MLKEIMVVKGKDGLHARPASEFVQLCKGIKSEVRLEKNGKVAQGKSIIGIMSLGIAHNEEVIVTVEGEDEAEGIKAIRELLSKE